MRKARKKPVLTIGTKKSTADTRQSSSTHPSISVIGEDDTITSSTVFNDEINETIQAQSIQLSGINLNSLNDTVMADDAMTPTAVGSGNNQFSSQNSFDHSTNPIRDSSSTSQEKSPLGFTITTTDANQKKISMDDFEKMEELGVGNGGVVTKVRHKKTNKIMAQKLVRLEVKKEVHKRIVNELKLLEECQHPNIVGYYGTFNPIQQQEIVICMEHMNGRSLDVLLKTTGRLPQKIIGVISVSVLRGCRYLHEEKKVMHRDIKPSNILVNSEGKVKLCDFGVSANLINSIANSFVGTRSYMAPERLMGTNNYTIKSDIWSLGITFLELAIGFYPIPKPTVADVLNILQNYPALDANNPSSFNKNAGSLGTGTRPTRTLAIFELLQYIASNPPPELYYFDPSQGFPEYFSKDFVYFVNSMIQQNMNIRPDLEQLMEMPYFNTSKAQKKDV